MKVTDTPIDKDGRYFMIRGTLRDEPLMLASTPAPNSAQECFLLNTLHTLNGFKNGPTVLMGDFNLVCYNDLNRSQSHGDSGGEFSDNK